MKRGLISTRETVEKLCRRAGAFAKPLARDYGLQMLPPSASHGRINDKVVAANDSNDV
jgi:hypothetical protein